MKYAELKEKNAAELNSMLAELRNSLYDLNRKRFMGQLADVRSIRAARKGIARLLTALSTTKS